MRNWQESGQTLLIVVLVMVVSLTVGLAVVSRSITSLRSSSEEASSQAAFSAAEAGVEQALKTGAGIEASNPQSLGNNAQIKEVAVTQIEGTEFLVNNGDPVSKDDGADIWLIEHNSDGTLNYSSGWQAITGDAKLTIYWGSSADSCSNAALEIVVITGTFSSPVSTRYVYDPCAERRAENHFTAPDSGTFTAQGKNFYYRETIDIKNSSKGLIVRIIPLYFDTKIAIKGCNKTVSPDSPTCNALPTQGSVITSTGESGSTQRKITLFRGYPRVPLEFFQYVLFSPR